MAVCCVKLGCLTGPLFVAVRDNVRQAREERTFLDLLANKVWQARRLEPLVADCACYQAGLAGLLFVAVRDISVLVFVVGRSLALSCPSHVLKAGRPYDILIQRGRRAEQTNRRADCSYPG